MSNIVNAPEEGNPDAVAEPSNPIPEKLRDKSAAEMAEMYTHLESKIGTQSEEIGELRRSLQTQRETPQPKVQEEELDFYTDPQRFVESIIDKRMSPVASAVAQQQEMELERRLDADFTGWRDTVKAQEFQEWVKKSPIRRNLWTSADRGDYDAASELFGNWKDISGSADSTKASTARAVKKDRAIRDATVEKGSPKIDGRKILNRVDLQELRRLNPDKYNALLPDIRKAYSEGRVR